VIKKAEVLDDVEFANVFFLPGITLAEVAIEPLGQAIGETL